MFLEPRHIPEFPEWMDEKSRAEVVREGMGRQSMDASLGFWVLTGTAATACNVLIFRAPLALPWLVQMFVFGGTYLAIQWVLVAWQRRVFHRSIREVLRERGVDVCSGCGYSMEGLGGASRCPECGRGVAEMAAVGRPVHGFYRAGERVKCVGCNYGLSGLANPSKCPECGKAIAGLDAE